MLTGMGFSSSIIDGDGMGSTNIAGDTSKSVRSVTVTATATNWNITQIGQNFMAAASSGSVQAARSGGGNISVTGSNYTSSVAFELGIGESAAYTFNLTYLLDADNSAADPAISWQLIHVSSATTIFSNADTTPAGANESIAELSGNLTLAGEYRLEIIGSVSGISGNNRTAISSLISTTFDLTSVVPEPSSFVCVLFGFALFTFYRRR